MTPASRHRLKSLALKRVVSGPGSPESRWRLLLLVWVWWWGQGLSLGGPVRTGPARIGYGSLESCLRWELGAWRSDAELVRRHNAAKMRWRAMDWSGRLAAMAAGRKPATIA